MPNWTHNEVRADRSVLEQILTEENGELRVDFNTLIPMPEELNVPSSGLCDEAVLYFLTERLTKPLTEKIEDKFNKMHPFFYDAKGQYNDMITANRQRRARWEKPVESPDGLQGFPSMYEYGRRLVENHDHFGSIDWHDWCVEHWGVKWNACYSRVTLDDGVATFETAWSVPMPFYREFCKRNPEARISFHYEYEDGGWVNAENKAGEPVVVESGTDTFDDADCDEYGGTAG